MGTWGYKTFENDAASDWLYDLEEAKDASFLLKPIKSVNGARGKLDLANLDRALKVQETARSSGANAEKLGSILSRLGMLSSRELAEALAQQRGWTIVELSEFPELPILEGAVSSRFLNEVRAIPVAETDSEVVTIS